MNTQTIIDAIETKGLMSDALRCVEMHDVCGLIFIANMAMEKNGNDTMKGKDAFALFDALDLA